jgi:hypothetical protein
MRIARASLFLFLFCFGLHADETNPQKITITGTLSRVMAIGAESTGWMVQVSSETVIDGKPISSIEVSDTRKPKQLEQFDNKVVKISGKVAYRHGVETGTQPYIEILSIKEVADSASSSDSSIGRWLGRWDGPEGTYLEISKKAGEYLLEIRNLDGSRTFEGSAAGPRIAFTRDGKQELLSAGDGSATGMKWLAGKKNCLLTKPGEGWCRD